MRWYILKDTTCDSNINKVNPCTDWTGTAITLKLILLGVLIQGQITVDPQLNTGINVFLSDAVKGLFTSALFENTAVNLIEFQL